MSMNLQFEYWPGRANDTNTIAERILYFNRPLVAESYPGLNRKELMSLFQAALDTDAVFDVLRGQMADIYDKKMAERERGTLRRLRDTDKVRYIT